MSRRRVARSRKILPDPKYHEELVTKFINMMMIDGKRSSAENQFYGAMDIIREKMSKAQKKSEIELFKEAVENAKPFLEVKSRRVGGSNYQVPVEVRPSRRQALAIRWMIGYARQKKGLSMREKLAGEMMDCINKTGSTIKKREEVHKMAEANKAFAHFRW